VNFYHRSISIYRDSGGFPYINPAMFAWAFAQDVNSTEADIMAARTMTKKFGKTIKEARSEVDKCAWVMDYFAYLNYEVMPEKVL